MRDFQGPNYNRGRGPLLQVLMIGVSSLFMSGN
jgi:hypothetical protein